MRQLLSLCAGVILAGSLAAGAVGQSEGSLEELGRAFVSGVQDKDMVAVAQCWLPHHRADRLMESYEEGGSPGGAFRMSGATDQGAERRNRRIVKAMRGLFGLFERRGISLSSLELAGVEARSMRKEGAVDRADEVELRMDAGQKMQLRYTVHGAVEIGGLWYFSGRPDTSVKVVENGQNQVVNLLRNQKRKPGPRAGRSRAERRPRRRNARRRGSGRRRGLRWHDSIRKALMEARRRRVPVVVDAYADWCGWCKKMEEETFTNPRVKQQLRRFALCKLDTEKYPNVTEKYNISGLPTTLVLRPDGQVMERKSGYMGPQKYMSFLRDAAGGSR